MPFVIRLCFSFLTIVFISGVNALAQETYTYDNAGRLKSVTYESGGPSTTYKYDDANNRIEEKTINVPDIPDPDPDPDPVVITTTHSSGAVLNMRTLADSLGYTGNGDITLDVTVSSNVTGSGGSSAAIHTGTWPSEHSVSLKLTINSGVKIYGRGGRGGNGGAYNASSGSSGGSGGSGINMNHDLVIVNNGEIHGGAGGGAGGIGFDNCDGTGEGDCASQSRGGNGGGGGWPNGLGGLGGSGGAFGIQGSNGAAGTLSGGGGNGGDKNQDGSSHLGVPGGSKGYGIKKNGHTLTLSGSGTNSGTGS